MSTPGDSSGLDGGDVDESDVRYFQEASLQRRVIDFGLWMNRESFERSTAAGHPELRPVHGAIFVHLGWDGRRLVDIARDAGLSKNAIGQLAVELEQFGYVERSPDPSDGRAKILRYTEKGRRLLSDAMRIGEDINRELAELIGERKLAQLQATLDQLASKGIGPARGRYSKFGASDSQA
jgi:DNA-binding MarR family transcriptional regulator